MGTTCQSAMSNSRSEQELSSQFGKERTLEDRVKFLERCAPTYEGLPIYAYSSPRLWMRRIGCSFEMVPFEYVSSQIKATDSALYGVGMPEVDAKFALYDVHVHAEDKGHVTVEYRASTHSTVTVTSGNTTVLLREKEELEKQIIKANAEENSSLLPILWDKKKELNEKIAASSCSTEQEVENVFSVSKIFHNTIWTCAAPNFVFQEFVFVNNVQGQISGHGCHC